MISVVGKWVYIHITKTAGISVERRLRSHFDDTQGAQHAGYPGMLRSTKYPGIKSYFSFAFVRNPWDRIVSLYHFHRTGVPKIKHHFVRENITFEDYVMGRKSFGLKNTREASINKNQLSWLVNERGSIEDIDFIGRFESLQRDWKIISERLKIEYKPLEHLNKTCHQPYQTYYTDELRDIIGKKYASDINFFDYRFEEMK